MAEHKHVIQEVWLDQQSKQVKEHLKECETCQHEQELLHTVEKSIETLPETSMPEGYRQKLILLMKKPAYRLWYFLVALSMVIITPLFLDRLIGQFQSTAAKSDTYIVIFAFVGILAIGLLLPIAVRIGERFDLHSFEDSVDKFLEHPIKSIRK